MKRIAIIIMMVSACITMRAQTRYAPFRPLPNENQLRWQDMEMYAFIHYSLNTYTDQEWGFGNEDLKLFNPSDLDCRQWARALCPDNFEITVS